jgi:hypothetical protein
VTKLTTIDIMRTRFALLSLLIAGNSPGDAATSVSQHGITWTFAEDRPVGQFANGDWWVVGPVTIRAISPADTAPADGVDMHGTMINPTPAVVSPFRGIHGWDSRVRDNSYVASLNIAKSLPRSIPAGSSVMSCRSVEATVSGNNQQLDTIAVLTVLAAAPPAGSFRPPYMGKDKTVRWNKAGLDYSKLRKLAPVTSTPTFASREPGLERVHIALTPMWVGTYLHPITSDSPGYGREISHKVGAAALLLNLNYTDAQKERLLILMVQRGIDIYGVRANGGGWWADGGHNHGRKFPMLLAGVVLNDAAIRSLLTGPFAEDGQHFYVTKEDVDRPRKTGKVPYTADMIGMPEWGGKHVGEPEGDSSAWDAAYRILVGVSNMGPVLATRIMGARDVWNQPAIFDYMDRFYSIESGNVSTGVNSIQPFVSEMWKAYRGGNGGTGPPPPPPPPAFAIGSRIAVTGDTNVRQTGSLSAAILGVQPAGTTGTLVAGPVLADNITWWQVDYDSGADGWSGADRFTTSSTTAPLRSGDRVATTRQTNVRDAGSLSATILGVQPAGATGTLLSGPLSADGIAWWRVDYDSGTDGWSGADQFVKSSTAPPPAKPSPPTGLRITD